MILKELMMQEDASSATATLVETGRASGPQWAGTALVADLLTQLAFSNKIADVISRPVVYRDRKLSETIAADVFFQTAPSHEGDELFLILVCEDDDPRFREPASDRIVAAARSWCAARGIACRALGAAEIRTPYLENAQRLGHLVRTRPDALEATEALTALIRRDGPVAVASVVRSLASAGIAQHAAAAAIERCVATRWILTDLDRSFGDASLLRNGTSLERSTNRSDPLLRAIVDGSPP